MLGISYSRNARKSIETVSGKHQRQIVRKIEELRAQQEPHDSQALKGALKPFRRADVGEYRIIYRVDDDQLLIAAVGRRNDDAIYREFGRSRTR